MIRSKIASRFKRAKTMPFLLAWLGLALHVWPGAVVPTHAQGTRKDDIVFNSRGIPLAGATVRVCAMPASGQPCSPLALLYSDAALTQAIANPTTTDGLGNYFFYAAPGKYEIEVSGPGITTKQLPDVVLPNDPSSPTFSGAISAFSLNLSGNLAVTGNTTVIGSLASGTLNLSNQSSPPGAASAGTVNLYTKSADKRLYYKDDTGTEIGPISTGGSGAQLNVVNTFTAIQNFDSDVETKGPNPNFSLARYGGYNSATSTPPSTTGTINATSTILTLASAQDFANGQGIVVWKAGPAPGVTTTGAPTVTPINLVNGSTTYNYKAVAEDRTGGLTAASGAGTTTVGAATLGANTVTLTTCVRTSGVTTYTSTSAHNLQVGTQVNIENFGGGVFDSCNGVKTIASTPTGTTFTVKDGTAADENTSTGSPTATVYACNTLTFPSGSYSGPNTIHYWIYRSIGAGAYSLAGVAQGVDPWWQDCGFSPPAASGYVPATPPGSTQAGYLATTIASGGGTTTLTLANAAGTSAVSQTVLHDNSVPLLNAVKAADIATGGSVYIPNGGANPYWLFNATTDFSALALSSVERIHINSNAVYLNQPWVVHGGMDFEGEPHVTTSFSYVNGSQIVGITAYPMFLMGEWGDGIHFNRLMLSGNQPQQTTALMDSGSDGGGTAGIVFDDVNFSGSSGQGTPVVIKGGFDFFFNRGTCEGGASSFEPQSCLQFTDASPAVTATGPAQVAGRIKVNGLYFAGNAIDIDCLPDGTSISPIDFTFNTTIFESQTAPYLRFNCPTGFFGGIIFNDVVLADSRVGFGTPVIDAQNDNDITSLSWTGGALPSAAMPGLITPSPFASFLLTDAPFNNPGNAVYTSMYGTGVASNGNIETTSPGRINTIMVNPTVVGLALSSGGAVPVGTWYYAVQYEDADGNWSSLSPGVTIATTTGNQTVTITPPAAPAGAIGFLAYRSLTITDGYARIEVGGCGVLPIASVPVDTISFTCGNGSFTASAGSSIVGPNGVSTPELRLVNNGNVLTVATPITANRTVTLPDLSGVALVTGYINTAFDNATRANGAIGANWTVTNVDAIDIASNNFVGTGANSVAYWSANTFNATQFSQVTLSALNGTTDFPGVAVLLSGSGSGTQAYSCLEDTTNVYLQKVLGTVNTTLTSAASTGAPGDILRLEAVPGATSVALTCYKNGVSALTTTDSSSAYLTGSPGLFLYGTVATEVNWSGGNLHPFSQLDVEQSWTQTQHFKNITVNGSNLATAPQNCPASTNALMSAYNSTTGVCTNTVPATYGTATNCVSTASPALCGAAAAGIVQVAAAATSLVVDTTAVTASSRVFFSYSVVGITPPANIVSLLLPYESAVTGGTSFTIALPVAPTTNPVNIEYWIIN